MTRNGNVHEVALEAGRPARVLYVDNDPDVVARSRALLAGGGDGAAALRAELPPGWRGHEEILGYFELLDPGLVPLPEWRPSPHSPRHHYAGHHAWVGGVARKR